MLRVVKGSDLTVPKFKTWADFEEDMSLIWKNAMHYNEDGSEIHNLAKQLEVCSRSTFSILTHANIPTANIL